MNNSDSIFIEKLRAGRAEAESRNLSDLFEKVRKAEKADLHFHLAGSMRPETLLDLASSDAAPIDWTISNAILKTEDDIGAAIRGGDLQKVRELLEYRQEPGSLQSYLDLYSIPQTVIGSPGVVRRVAYEAAEASYDDGVRKLEVRFNPIRLDGGVTPEKMIRAVSEGLEEAEKDFPGLRTGLIICINKTFSGADVADIVKMTLDTIKNARLEGRVVAMDTSGPEIGFEAEKFAEPFRRAREEGGLGIVSHAGEDFLTVEDGLDAIEKSITLLKAKRIGHGLAAGLAPEAFIGKGDGNGDIYSEERLESIRKKQERVLSLLVDLDVALEVCPSSNIHTGKLENLKNHPIERFIKSGVPVAISTDNTRISHTKLTWEYLRIAMAFGYGFETISKIIETGNAYSYVEC